jgi:2,4-dienoyl-CoA reductase-like NADH-dependent reductase (Old Yellow Enzyme family)
LEQAEALLKAEKADVIGVGRAILADENWVSNAFSNFVEEA